MGAHRPAKEGVTAVAGAAGSAARRQPTQTGRGARVAQQSRVEPADAAVTLVPDESAGGGGPPACPRSGRESRWKGHAAGKKGEARGYQAPGTAGYGHECSL